MRTVTKFSLNSSVKNMQIRSQGLAVEHIYDSSTNQVYNQHLSLDNDEFHRSDQ